MTAQQALKGVWKQFCKIIRLMIISKLVKEDELGIMVAIINEATKADKAMDEIKLQRQHTKFLEKQNSTSMIR